MDLLFNQAVRSVTAYHCCVRLSEALGAKVSYPGNTTYQATEASYWSVQESTLSPSCIVVPGVAKDVSTAISIVSRIEGCYLAIKGQGHSPAAGFANIDGGVTIDMTPLDSVAVNLDHTVVSIGAGASWLDVYKYLDPLGLSVAGGRNGQVGVGGLALGGGISYFAPRVGWSCDNVVNFEIVLASGEIASANSKSRPDLFRALKGGSNNFGVVTRFDFTPFAQGQIIGGGLVQDISNREAVFKAVADIASAPHYDVYASLVLGVSFNSTSKVWSISETPVYTKPDLSPPVYKDLLDIPTTSNTLHVTNLSTLADEAAIPQFNWLFFTGTYSASAAVLSKAFDLANATLYSFQPTGGVFWSITFEPLPTVLTSYGSLKGGNSLGTSPKDGNAIVLLVSALWTDSSSDSAIEQTARTMVDRVNAAMKAMGTLHSFQYLNYADPSQNPIQTYGQMNVQHLEEVSKRHDPKGFFQKQVPGGFKLAL